MRLRMADRCGNLLQIREGDLVLGRDPGGDVFRRADVVFQPAVRVGHLGAVVIVYLIDAPRRGILHGLLGIQSRQPQHGQGQEQKGSFASRCSPTG